MSFIDWKDLFDDIFESYPNKWILTFLHRNNPRQYQKLQNNRQMERTGYARYMNFFGFFMYRDCFFDLHRFHCPKCSKAWTSAKAKVIFYYPNNDQPLGKVTLRFFGQQCKQCSHTNDYFVDPEFENETIKLFLEKLYERIGWFCYGKKRPKTIRSNDHHENKIDGPHEKALCEACRMGCCDKTSIKAK
jgi:hypothetical protein